jgi:FtsH-binding integral membrane protein
MSQFPETRRIPLEYGTDEKSVFNFFNAVYAWMAVGLAVTAAMAWTVAHTPALANIMYASRGMIALFAIGAFLIAWGVQSAAEKISAGVATALFLVYAALIGAMISGIFIIYNMQTIMAAFLLTGGTFAVMSIYGFVTKRDLTQMGSILVMCVVGLFLASLVNLWIASNALSWVITYAVLAVFIGLTAYHTQQLKNLALAHQHDPNMAARYAIIGSLLLYIAFINMFLSILRIIGGRK